MERCSCSECKRIQQHIHTLTAGFFQFRQAQFESNRLYASLEYRNFEAAQAFQAYQADMEADYLDA